MNTPGYRKRRIYDISVDARYLLFLSDLHKTEVVGAYKKRFDEANDSVLGVSVHFLFHLVL